MPQGDHENQRDPGVGNEREPEPFDEKAQSGYCARPGEPDYGGYGLSPGHRSHKYDEFDPNSHEWRREQAPSVTPGYADGAPGASDPPAVSDAAEPRDE